MQTKSQTIESMMNLATKSSGRHVDIAAPTVQGARRVARTSAEPVWRTVRPEPKRGQL